MASFFFSFSLKDDLGGGADSGGGAGEEGSVDKAPIV